MLKKIIFALCLICGTCPVYAKTVQIVAAENFYGNVAAQIGGPNVSVTSIMSNPNQDPHLFSSSASTAKAIASAEVIIYNGINYDPWMKNLILSNKRKDQTILVVADLIGKKEGDNPHIWYDPNTMLIFSQQLSEKLSQLDPAHKEYFQKQLAQFEQEYKTLLDEIEKIKKRFQGTSVIATESVFNYMASSLGLKMNGINFQLSIMNDTEPSASDLSDFEDKLKNRTVKILIYNSQVTSPITERLLGLAKKARIPVVGVTETLPLNQDYIAWMNNELSVVEKGLMENGDNP